MASSKVMPSTSTSTNSDLNSLSYHHHHHLNNHHSNHTHSYTSSQMIPEFHSNNSNNNNFDGLLRDVYGDTSSINNNNTNPNTLLDTEITLIDAAGAISAIEDSSAPIRGHSGSSRTAEEVWREIVNGKNERKECKVEAPDEMMTLEDFLAKAGAGIDAEEGVEVEADVKVEISGGGSGGLFAGGFDHGMVSSSYAPAQMAVPVSMGYGNGGSGGMEAVGGGAVRGKRRGGPMLEPLDKAAQQRQRRMIKNRESAARSRERKQAYQVELESLAHKLEEENEQLLREKAERTKERFKQLMDKVVPIEEKQRQPRLLRRVRSMQW